MSDTQATTFHKRSREDPIQSATKKAKTSSAKVPQPQEPPHVKGIIRVHQKGSFKHDDLRLNSIVEERDLDGLPQFVKATVEKLDAPRTLYINDVKALLKEHGLEEQHHFEPYKVATPHIPRTAAQSLEMEHVFKCSRPSDGFEHFQKSLEVGAIAKYLAPFVDYIKASSAGHMIDCTFGSQSWQWPLVTQVLGKPGFIKYTPKSDTSFWQRRYPRFVSEVFSQGAKDPIRPLLQGGAVVRLANDHLPIDTKHKKQFTLYVVYIDNKMTADFYLFFENVDKKVPVTQGDLSPVYFVHDEFLLLYPRDRLQFLLRMYNLMDQLMDYNDGNVPTNLPTEYIDIAQNTTQSTFLGGDGGGGKSGSALGGNQGGEDEQQDTQDEDHGNQDEDQGNESVDGPDFKSAKYELVSQQYTNIYKVRRIGDASKTCYIAKRLRPDSAELDILQRLRGMNNPCENIIHLIDITESNKGLCVILPEYSSVKAELIDRWFDGGGVLSGRYMELSCDLVRAMTFLHENGIAHLDIKPANMLFTPDFRLIIIDFDTSVAVDNENTSLWFKGYFGTKPYMAPEFKKRGASCMPIRADRYSCGRVFEAFAKFGWMDEERAKALQAFGERLMDADPYKRPPLTEWYEAASGLSDADDNSDGLESETLDREEGKEISPPKTCSVGFGSIYEPIALAV